MYKKYFLVDQAKLEYLRIQKGWSVEEIQLQSEELLERELSSRSNGHALPKLRGGKRDAKITKGTLFNIANGKPVMLETVRVLATLFGIDDVSRILAKGELPPVGPPGTWGEGHGPFASLTDWEPDELVGVLPRRTHGIESELWKLRHRFVPGRSARGKLYLTDSLADAEKNRLREYLVRHADVCHRLAGHRWFPRNITCAPDASRRLWWVVDEWVEGETLAERLDLGGFEPDEAKAIAAEVARALHCLHEHGVVRRDLSPDDILLGEDDDAVILTDLELAKVLEGRPTVAPADSWGAENPLRAPEVGSPDAIDPRVDLYSWGRLTSRLLGDSYPPPLPPSSYFDGLGLPDELKSFVASCVSVDRRKRPTSFAPVLAKLEAWGRT